MIDFLKKHKERVTLIGLGLAFLLFVVGGIYLQKKNIQEKESHPEVVPKTVELEVRQQGEGEKASTPAGASSSFFLKPSPEELLEQLAEMEYLNEDVVSSKFLSLRVMWETYFFSLEKTDKGKAILLLDVSEDGFGVAIQSEVVIESYPQLLEQFGGDKIWIAGEILAVDPSGTGTIYLKTEHIKFGGEPPVASPSQKTE